MWDLIRLDDLSMYRETIRVASPGQKALYSYWCYIGQVDNGGHDQFFFNQTGIVWKELSKGFELVGAIQHAEVFRVALTLFPNGTPSEDQETRQWQLNHAVDSDELDQVDAEFGELTEDYIALSTQYMDRFPSDFFTD